MIQLLDEKYLNSIKDVLHEKLSQGAVKRVLVDSSFTRGIGKTTALINFAKLHGLTVFVKGREVASLLRNKFNYQHIFSDTQARSVRGSSSSLLCVIDEGVNSQQVKDSGFTVVTGFTDK